MPERAASAIPTGLTVRVRGIPMPHLSVLFSLYFNSAAHPRHVMSAFVPRLGTANVDGSITDLIHNLTAPASPVALRYDLTWLSLPCGDSPRGIPMLSDLASP